MNLNAALAPLAAYAVFFQTAVYLSIPAPLRSRWAPLFTGLVGGALTLGSGLIFGFGPIGLGTPRPLTTLGWGLAGVALTGAIGSLMLARPSIRSELGDPRFASLRGREAALHILVRIPVLTALIEEVVFRGVLHAALSALYPTPLVIWLGAGLFGLWHIGPGLDQAEAVHVSRRARAVHTAVTVVVTTLAGAFLVWLRIETGSVWAPVAVHAGTNMTMALVSRLATFMTLTGGSAPSR